MSILIRLFLLFILVSSLNLNAQNDIIIGRKDTLYSKILNEKREIWVSVPTTYNKYVKVDSFPVVYVLNAPDYFLSLVGMIERFSNNIGNEECPPMIVVGVICPNYWSDCNPNLDDDKFSMFLKNELIPFVDKNYPTKPFRTVIGHSLGGLRVVHTAIYNNDLFNNYIAIDPSLGNERNKWYNKSQIAISKFQLKQNKLFIGMGQTMPYKKVQDTADIKKDTTSDSNHMRKIMEFSEKMNKKNTQEDISFKWIYYPKETHQSLTQIAIYDGLKFLFDWYKNSSLDEILDPNTQPDIAVKLLKDYYSRVSLKLGYAIIPPDNSVMIDYLFTYKKQKDKALLLAEYNLECHPKAQNAIDWVAKIKNDLKKK